MCGKWLEHIITVTVLVLITDLKKKRSEYNVTHSEHLVFVLYDANVAYYDI